MRACEDRDEGVVELLGRGMSNGLLRDVDVRSDGVEQPEAAEPEAESGQRRAWREVLGVSCHGAPPEGVRATLAGAQQCHRWGQRCAYSGERKVCSPNRFIKHQGIVRFPSHVYDV